MHGSDGATESYLSETSLEKNTENTYIWNMSMECIARLRFVLLVLIVGLCHFLKPVSAGWDDIPEPVTDEWETIRLWPSGIVPYNISDGMYDVRKRGVLLAAMRRWEFRTCVRFEPWSADKFPNTAVNLFSVGNCFSRTGMQQNQPQLLGLGSGCFKMWTVLHELGHTLGLVHEMERVDRDMYIQVHFQNLNPASVRNFHTSDEKHVFYDLRDTPYDYTSIMHYGPRFWSANKQPTIETLDPAYQHVIGNTDDVSFYDALYVNRAYNCSARCPESLRGLCQHGGFVGGASCRCVCPPGYRGEFCEQTIPGNNHMVEWQCQKGWDYNEGTCYLLATDTRSYARASVTCRIKGGTLAIFKERRAMEWLRLRIGEARMVEGHGHLWVGVAREAGETEVTWADETLVDSNLISVRDGVSSEVKGCGRYDGETVTLEDCATTSGYICQKPHDPTCGGRYMATLGGRTIQSPGFPSSYPSDSSCTYVIQTNPGSRIRVHFDDSSLLEANCDNDYVDINLANNVTAEFTRYCGESLSGTIFTSEGSLTVLIFRSNSRFSYRGFRATVTELPAPGSTTPISFLDVLRDALRPPGRDENEGEETRWSLSALYRLTRNMAFSRLTK
ncbi:zinc metalloproteinase nas-36-like [Mya arenaria]|nr:zinc metalloproteinase nas-36-like [Mya arenaria]